VAEEREERGNDAERDEPRRQCHHDGSQPLSSRK
jgi:hypothetical protein